MPNKRLEKDLRTRSLRLPVSPSQPCALGRTRAEDSTGTYRYSQHFTGHAFAGMTVGAR